MELSTSSRFSSFCPHRCVTHYRPCVTQQQHAKLQHSLNMSEPYSKEPCQSTLSLCQCTIMSSSKSLSLHSPLFYLNMSISRNLQASTHKHTTSEARKLYNSLNHQSHNNM
ncbi:hypothetical protein YC2023_012548 [Brassica napus]